MVVWLRPEYILALVTSLYLSSQIVKAKTYEKFWCATEEGLHQLSCPDENALLMDISVRKVYRRTQMCEPDDHSEYLIHCQSSLDSSLCEGNQTCSITISSQDYLQCDEKTYAPTYFFVKYTCTQIHTMCSNNMPLRNTLYGYIVSPGYPYPMADNVKCSLSIEADPAMYIELSTIHVQLQEAITCRSEYLEIFGYDSSDQRNTNENNIWKSYYTWCGTSRSLNNPLPNARYLITSNSLYMSLQTAVSKKPRYFKIRYKIVPSTARSYYNSDGIAVDSTAKGMVSSGMRSITSTNIISTTMIIPSLNNSEVKPVNGTVMTKRTLRKEILIGILVGVAVLLIAIIAGIVIFILMKRRRSGSSMGKKPASPTTSTNTSKSAGKSSDKAPLLESANNASSAAAAAAAAAKRKLVPERTLQISDIGSSRFKSNETSSTKADSSTTKPTLTAADSGIYGADLTEELSTPSKIAPDLPPLISDSNTTEPNPTVVTRTLSPINSARSSIVVHSDITENNPPMTLVDEEREPLLDQTIQSAYTNMIDATNSENEGTICGSATQSRRTSALTIDEGSQLETIVLSEELDSLSHHLIPFNPLHVILKKDANKYYTTEYI